MLKNFNKELTVKIPQGTTAIEVSAYNLRPLDITNNKRTKLRLDEDVRFSIDFYQGEEITHKLQLGTSSYYQKFCDGEAVGEVEIVIDGDELKIYSDNLKKYAMDEYIDITIKPKKFDKKLTIDIPSQAVGYRLEYINSRLKNKKKNFGDRDMISLNIYGKKQECLAYLQFGAVNREGYFYDNGAIGDVAITVDGQQLTITGQNIKQYKIYMMED